MKTNKQFWITISLLNLCIVATLGVALRSKILFPLEYLDFKYLIHAHSHFAFGGWLTLILITLMIYEILPNELSCKKIYNYILWGFYLNAIGMLISFLIQGYAFFSILFSTLFIFFTYLFSYVFIKDIIKSKRDKTIAILTISAAIYLIISSLGPFTLAYLMATQSHNPMLFKDAIYTYLHMQYNGFFTLSVFAILYNNYSNKFNNTQLKKSTLFAIVISLSIIPSQFISYLWHYNNIEIRTISIIGSILIILSCILLIRSLISIKNHLSTLPKFIRTVGTLSIVAFLLKSILQTGTIIPELGTLVFGDRAIIIGYLHLVLLGFISLYIIAQLLFTHNLDSTNRNTKNAIIVFTTAIIANEVTLMIQGFGNMLMVSNKFYTWILWAISIALLTGSFLIFFSRLAAKKIKIKLSKV